MAAKVITSSNMKGGVGKTTVIKNVANYIATQKKEKVLAIDADYICNFSQMFDVFDQEGSIGEIFRKENENIEDEEEYDPLKVKIHKVHENIDLIAGDLELVAKENALTADINKYSKLFKWMFENEKLISKYDYILIDTHNNFDTVTKNAIAVSDIVIAPDRPSVNNEYTADNIEIRMERFRNEMVDIRTGESFITAKLYLIGNMLENNIGRHNKFKKALFEKDNALTFFPKKELMVKATEKISSMEDLINEEKNKNDHWDFLNTYNEAIEKIIKA